MRWMQWLAAALIALPLYAASYEVLLRFLRIDTNYPARNPRQQQLLLYSEQSLYYWHYSTIVATPQLGTAFERLLADTGWEHPNSTINTLQRFTVWPEVLLGLIYRYAHGGPVSRPDDPQAFDFMMRAVCALNGLATVGIFWTATATSGSVLGGAVAVVVCMLHFSVVTRLTTGPVLRENFAAPWVWLQLTALCLLLASQQPVSRQVDIISASDASASTEDKTGKARGASVAATHSAATGQPAPHPGPTRRWQLLASWLYCILTIALLLSWQFSPFLLLLQTVAVFGGYALHVLGVEKMGQVLLLMQLSAVVGSLLMFGNGMVVTSLWICATVATQLVVYFLPSDETLGHKLMQGVLVAGLSLLLKRLSTLVVDDDGHVMRLIAAQTVGFEDFMTGLYFCGAQYQHTSWAEIMSFVETGALLAGGLAAALAGLRLLLWPLPNRINAVLAVLVAQCVLYILLGMGVRRLANMLVPSMGILAAVLAGPHLYAPATAKAPAENQNAKSKSDWRWLRQAVPVAAAAILLAMFWQQPGLQNFVDDAKAATYDAKSAPKPGFDGTYKLMQFLETNTHPRAVIASDPVLSATIRQALNRTVILHPHVENLDIRLKHHRFFQVFNRVPESFVVKMMRQWRARILVLADGPCNVHCGVEKRPMAYYANLADDSGKNAGLGQPNLPVFCQAARDGHVKELEMIYNEPPFRVFRLPRR